MITLRDGDRGTSSPSVVSIGVFDGLHRGHQAVIKQLLERGDYYSATPTVVTFDPAPAMVLAPSKAPRLLATLDQRLEGFASLGVDQVRVITFNSTRARESATSFIDRVLVGELGARCVVVGEDFHFGHLREGTVQVLRDQGSVKGFELSAAPLHGDERRWSSTGVRQALGEGDVEGAGRILGYPFTLRGVVVYGDQRGRELGFPTANLAVDEYQLLPSQGVYAGASFVEGQWRPVAISLGRRPQFYVEGEFLVEAYVLDFVDNLYDRCLDVVFLRRLRAQEVFGTLQELTRQIERDVLETRQIFREFSNDDAKLLGWNFGQRR